MCPSAKDIIKFILSEHEDKCIMMQDEVSLSDMVIIQEGMGFGAVAEVVEVKTDTWLFQHALPDLLLYLIK